MTIQALVFDLDDTLMDTHGQLVPEAHRQACFAMQKAGLDIPFEELYGVRMQLVDAFPRGDINQLLAAHFNCEDPDVPAAGHTTYFNPQIGELKAFPGVPEMLADLQQDFHLFLLTSGYPEPQAQKVNALGISAFFKQIYYASIDEPAAKKQALEQIAQDYDYAFSEIMVIGDRINNEILWGNHLGCVTVWIQQGECAGIVPESPEEKPHRQVSSVTDLPQILKAWPQ